MKKVVFGALFIAVFAALTAQLVWAQTQEKEPRWGLQVDLGTSFVPKSILKLKMITKALGSYRLDRADGQSGNIGLVRFNEKGGASFGLYYSEVRLEGAGVERRPYPLPYQFQPPGVDPSDPLTTIEESIDGHGHARGVMVTKFANFVTRKHVSFGMRFGIGVGEYKIDYTRGYSILTQSGKEFSSSYQEKAYRHVWPMFEILSQIDVRPIKFLSFGPVFGIRNGAVVINGALTFRF